MEAIPFIFAGVALYLYLEIWTVRICLRYGAWLAAAVLAIDHLLLLVTFTGFPLVLFWKVWFIWTTLLMEPVRGLLWVPDLRELRYRRVAFWGGPLATRLVLMAVFALALLLTAGGLLGSAGEGMAALALLVFFLPPAILTVRWCYLKLRGWFGPLKPFPEPVAWERGPTTW